MSEDAANKLIREYRSAGIMYDTTLEPGELKRLNLAGVALFQALVGQPSTDTTEEGR